MLGFDLCKVLLVLHPVQSTNAGGTTDAQITYPFRVKWYFSKERTKAKSAIQKK
jgi:hypothetical protein